MFYWRVDVLCRLHRLRSSCLPLIWLLRSYWDNKVESGHYSYTHMVPISPWRPCHCTGLLLHALLANCWKKKNALGRGQKFTAQYMLGHLILLSNSNLLRRPRWSLIKAEMKGRQRLNLRPSPAHFKPSNVDSSSCLSYWRSLQRHLDSGAAFAETKSAGDRWDLKRKIITISVSHPFL